MDSKIQLFHEDEVSTPEPQALDKSILEFAGS